MTAASGGDGQGDRWGDLLAAVQGGDSDAYRGFLNAIIPFVRAIARRRYSSDDVAEDAVQDVVMTVHRARHTYQLDRPVEPCPDRKIEA